MKPFLKLVARLGARVAKPCADSLVLLFCLACGLCYFAAALFNAVILGKGKGVVV